MGRWDCSPTRSISRAAPAVTRYAARVKSVRHRWLVQKGRTRRRPGRPPYQQTYDYETRTSSLDRKQTQLRPDGSFRMVVVPITTRVVPVSELAKG